MQPPSQLEPTHAIKVMLTSQLEVEDMGDISALKYASIMKSVTFISCYPSF